MYNHDRKQGKYIISLLIGSFVGLFLSATSLLSTNILLRTKGENQNEKTARKEMIAADKLTLSDLSSEKGFCPGSWSIPPPMLKPRMRFSPCRSFWISTRSCLTKENKFKNIKYCWGKYWVGLSPSFLACCSVTFAEMFLFPSLLMLIR